VGGRSLTGVATFVVLATAWYALTTLTHTISPGRFPAPGETWDALRQIAITGYADARLHEHILHSVKLVLFGFAAATIVGVPLGLAMGASRAFEAFINPSFLLIRPIPPLAWIPLAMVIGPNAICSAVGLIGLAVWFPVTMLTASGISNTRATYLDFARTLGAGRAYLEADGKLLDEELRAAFRSVR
jgi:NitT/TauT family transport system permease protein/taurine transport system permease protein